VSCRQHFHKDVRKQLYSDSDDRQFFDRIKCGLKTIEGRLEEGRVALQHLELFLVNVACDDPGATIGSQLVLPLLQVRRCVVDIMYVCGLVGVFVASGYAACLLYTRVWWHAFVCCAG
jgi:hypothetical protein